MSADQTPPLALRPRDAAKALGISPRTLWKLTTPRGPIPAVKIGTAVLYPVPALRDWLAQESAKLGAVGEAANDREADR